MKILDRGRATTPGVKDIERNMRLDRGLVSEGRLRRELYSVTSTVELAAIAVIGVLASALGVYLAIVRTNPSDVEEVLGVVLTALGVAFVASSVFAFFYGKKSQERLLFAIASESANTTQNLFVERFANVLPELIFPESKAPSDDYYMYFTRMLESSNNYYYKGDVAALTSVRIANLSGTTKALVNDRVQMLLLDPRSDPYFCEAARAQVARAPAGKNPGGAVTRSGGQTSDLDLKIAEMKTDVLTTIWGLHLVRDRLPRMEIGVYSYPPVFFSQLVDDGLFLSFYLGGEYPRGYFYNRESVVFKAYSQDFRLTWEIAQSKTDTRCLSNLSGSGLSEWLTTLGLGKIKLDSQPVVEETLTRRWEERKSRFVS